MALLSLCCLSLCGTLRVAGSLAWLGRLTSAGSDDADALAALAASAASATFTAGSVELALALDPLPASSAAEEPALPAAASSLSDAAANRSLSEEAVALSVRLRGNGRYV